MNIWKSIGGMLEIELTSADLGDVFCAAGEARIPLYCVETLGPLTAKLMICRRDHKALTALCDKRGDHIKILRKLGLYWKSLKLLHRPILLIGIGILTALFLILPTRVLFIRVEGNQSIPTNQILEAAEACGIRFGISRRAVRSERVKNRLLGEVPALQWAGVNTHGCVAVISVRERWAQTQERPNPGITNVVAARDGVVDSCTALRGNLLCQPGQAVTQGQILISGYTDCGTTIQAASAQGEIFARTIREFQAVTPAQEAVRGEISGKKRSYRLVLGKNIIKFPRNSGIWDSSCGRMYEEYYITLPGGYQLPIALAVDEYTFYDTKNQAKNPNHVHTVLKDFEEDSLRNQMIAGTILQGKPDIIEENGLFVLRGRYLCREMIGRVRQEKIGE